MNIINKKNYLNAVKNIKLNKNIFSLFLKS